MSQPDQQHKLLPQPGPWCRGGTGPRGGQQSGSGAPPSFLAADVGPPPLLFLCLPHRAATGDPAQHPAARLLPARPESYGDERRRRRPGVTAGFLYVSHRSEERKAAVSCGESRFLHCPRGARRLSRSKAGNGRQKRSQTPTGSGLPPRGSEQRSRASPARSCRHVPSCAARAPPCSEPRWGLGCSRVRHLGPHPRRAVEPAAGPLSAPIIAGAHPAEAAAGSAKQQPKHSREVPRPPVPQHPSGNSRSALQEAKTEQTKTP
ncbi:uncharacterized protein LOC116480818 [Hylobates moloch]|uniref:uncharacterized protein LOC116480818 n=1 Tax=Hylobates moloch TaxID=81572 RepID=UPI001362FCA5|nr:uncharacterized protein LOC116480818 [Hylobates moloch]